MRDPVSSETAMYERLRGENREGTCHEKQSAQSSFRHAQTVRLVPGNFLACGRVRGDVLSMHETVNMDEPARPTTRLTLVRNGNDMTENK